MALFGAMFEPTPEAYNALAVIVPAASHVALFTTAPLAPTQQFEVAGVMETVQMVDGGLAVAIDNRSGSTALEAGDVQDMVSLTSITKPGPFASRTIELGRYIGIRAGGELVAMAGERLRYEGYVEVSAVCVHPEHRAHGLAQLFVRELVTGARRRGETPFLHVFADNAPAMSLYRRLGFRPRRRMWATRLLRIAR